MVVVVVVVEAETLQCQREGQWLVFAAAGGKWEKKEEAECGVGFVPHQCVGA